MPEQPAEAVHTANACDATRLQEPAEAFDIVEDSSAQAVPRIEDAARDQGFPPNCERHVIELAENAF